MFDTAAKAKERLENATANMAAEIINKPGDAGRLANGIANRLGTYDALKQWEAEMAGVAEYAEKEEWSELRVVATKHRILSQMALRPVGDEWSGRGNDERRSYADGRREALSELYFAMSHEYGEAVQADGGLLDAGMN